MDRIVFYGELNIEKTNINKNDFSFLEKLSNDVLVGKLNYNEIEEIIFKKFEKADYTYFLWKTRNLIRYKYLNFLSEEYNEKLILIGDELKILKKATNLDSDYSLNFRKNIYNKYKGAIFIDLLCKSTPSCLYARSQELIANVDFFFQLNSFDSKLTYGDKYDSIVFKSKFELKSIIDKQLINIK